MTLDSTLYSRPLRAFISGSGARVGRAIALELARHRFELALHYYQNEQGATETLDAVRELGGKGITIQADLGDPASRKALSEQLITWSTHLHLLVNNASLFKPKPFGSITDEEWQQMYEVNVHAPAFLAQAALPALKASRGLIINLCDIGADRPLLGYSHYSSSKAALIGLTRALAVELAPEVRCVGISPGQVAWPPSYTVEQRASLSARIPMKEGGSPEDIAQLVRFLMLEGAYINGAIIPVDGGLSCRY